MDDNNLIGSIPTFDVSFKDKILNDEYVIMNRIAPLDDEDFVHYAFMVKTDFVDEREYFYLSIKFNGNDIIGSPYLVKLN